MKKTIIAPTIAGIRKEKLEYKGFIFLGLIKVNDEPFVIEYNCRMGDPETEVVLPKLKNDVVELFASVYNGNLASQVIEMDERACCTIVAVSGGYPGNYKKNIKIVGLQKLHTDKDIVVFHAGTKQNGDEILTNGGRVLAVTSFGNTIKNASANALNVLNQVSFAEMYFRKDIGYEFTNEQ